MMRFGAVAARWGSLGAAALVGAATSCNDGAVRGEGSGATPSSGAARRDPGDGGASRPADASATSARPGAHRSAPDDGAVVPDDGASPSRLHALGLAEEQRGNLIAARRLLAASLALRRQDDVEAALRRVGGLPCDPCASQEDFDAAHRRGTVCCPVIGCERDADCPDGRVCCRIPDGQLCGDEPRCSPEQRVEPP